MAARRPSIFACLTRSVARSRVPAKCTAEPKNDPNNEDERRLHGFFHCRPQRAGSMIYAQSSAFFAAFAALNYPEFCSFGPPSGHIFHVHPPRRTQGGQKMGYRKMGKTGEDDK